VPCSNGRARTTKSPDGVWSRAADGWETTRQLNRNGFFDLSGRLSLALGCRAHEPAHNALGQADPIAKNSGQIKRAGSFPANCTTWEGNPPFSRRIGQVFLSLLCPLKGRSSIKKSARTQAAAASPPWLSPLGEANRRKLFAMNKQIAIDKQKPVCRFDRTRHDRLWSLRIE
jgi:hypothetical protein